MAFCSLCTGRFHNIQGCKSDTHDKSARGRNSGTRVGDRGSEWPKREPVRHQHHQHHQKQQQHNKPRHERVADQKTGGTCKARQGPAATTRK
ncbi:unnamed protein product [Ectocarpus sp. 12 AP-2014]